MDKGFTKFPNTLLESIINGDFTCTETKVLLSIVRYTKGYLREEGSIAISYLATIAGRSERAIKYAIKSLTEKNVISKKGVNKYGVIYYSINDLTLWKGCNILHPHSDEDCTTRVQRTSPPKVQCSSPNKDNNIKINNKYNLKAGRESRTPITRTTAFSNFNQRKNACDYKAMELESLRKKLERSRNG